MSILKLSVLVLLAAFLPAFLLGETMAGETMAGGLQQPEARGLFGTISELSGDGAGEIDITLDTDSGPVELTATSATKVRIPGWESASMQNLYAGDSVAVVALGEEATSILVRTGEPVGTRHFTGVVISADEEEGTVSLQNRQGDHISAPALGDLRDLRTGELVTAVVEQDLRAGGMLVTGLDRAVDSLGRIESALELAHRSQASSNLEALQQRLIGNSTHHLTAIQEAAQKAAPAQRSRVRQELESALETYAAALSQSNAGEPRAEVAGIITSIDEQRQRVTVEPPHGLEPADIAITGSTSLWRAPAGLPAGVAEIWLRGGVDTRSYVGSYGGRETRLEQLDLASRVRVWYALDTASASRVLVLPGESLQKGTADVLRSLTDWGESTGVVTAVDLDAVPPAVAVQDDATGTAVNLTVSPESVFLDGDLPVGISTLVGASVAASFDPESLSIIELNTLTLAPSEATLSGVVHSFISKVSPANFSILTPNGEIRSFNRTDDTIIRRDGRLVTISQVRLGDLVRPNTRYRPEAGGAAPSAVSGGDLVRLSLKSPQTAPVRGTIRGVTALPDGDIQVTLSNNWLELVSLLVTGQSLLTMQGRPVGINEVAVGHRVLAGEFDPISAEATRLMLEPPRTLQVKGEITAVDEDQSAITITPRRGDPVRLFVLDSTPVRISLRGTTGPRFSDLRQGQRVRIGFYDPGSMEALRLVIN